MARGTHSGFGHVVAPLLRYIAIFMTPFFENTDDAYFSTTKGMLSRITQEHAGRAGEKGSALKDLLSQQAISRDRGGDKEADKC
jgi:hypothetical protein